MANTTTSKPVRVGAFRSIHQADQAVRDLLAAGFHKDQLAVVCSDKHKEQFFSDLPTLERSGSHAPQGALAETDTTHRKPSHESSRSSADSAATMLLYREFGRTQCLGDHGLLGHGTSLWDWTTKLLGGALERHPE